MTADEHWEPAPTCPQCGARMIDQLVTPEYLIDLEEWWWLGCPRCGYQDEDDASLTIYHLDEHGHRIETDES